MSDTSTFDLNKLIVQLTPEEGVRFFPYDDATGKTLNPGDTLKGNLTIAIGWNLTANPIPKEISDRLTVIAIGMFCDALDAAPTTAGWWRTRSDVEQRVMLDLTFNMGPGWLSSFAPTLVCWKAGDIATVDQHLENTNWYRDGGWRGKRLIAMLLTGKDNNPVDFGG